MVTVNEKVGRGLVCVGEHWSKNGAIDAVWLLPYSVSYTYLRRQLTASLLPHHQTSFSCVDGPQASHAASWPVHSCRLLIAFRISSRVTLSIALEMRCLSVSPTPIGLTPGLLSRVIRRHAVRADIPCGST